MANRMIVLQKLKNKNTIWFATPLLGTHLKELKAVSKRYLYTHVHSNMIHNTQNNPSVQWRMDEQNGLYTQQNMIQLLQRKEFLTHATTQMSVGGHYAK